MDDQMNGVACRDVVSRPGESSGGSASEHLRDPGNKGKPTENVTDSAERATDGDQPKLSIAMITGFFPMRSETFVVEHAVGLARRGHDVHVISYGPGPGISAGEIRDIRQHGVELHVIPGFADGKLGNARRFLQQMLRHPGDLRHAMPDRHLSRGDRLLGAAQRRLLSRLGPDVVHVHFGMLAARLVCSREIEGAVVTWHGIDANVIPRHKGEEMYRDLFATGAIHTVGSDFMSRRLVELGAQPASIRKAPMGVDLSKFPYHDRAGRDGEAVKVVSVGRLDEMKGHGYLIDAVAARIDSGQAVELDIIGEGHERALLEERIASSGHSGKIRLRGARPVREVIRFLEEADIFALGCVEARDGRVETQGVAIIEAQASGLPVVVGRAGGAGESLVDGVSGYLVNPTTDEFASRLGSLVGDAALRLEFGRSGRQLVTEKFSLERMNDTFERLYASRQ